jgi:hypothetical protein
MASDITKDKDKKAKPPKDTGILSIRTTENSYPVRIDGLDAGMTGVGSGAEFYLMPGFHTVEVIGPYGKVWKDEIEIRRGVRNCICLKVITKTDDMACPYRFHLEGPDRVNEGDLVTFSAINSGTSPVPLRYAWNVRGGRVTSGLGTPSITVDSTGMGRGTISAELDVNDDTYDGRCRQVISVPTDVIPFETPKKPIPLRCDEFEASNRDQDKARFDNCVIQLQSVPDGQLYVIIYPGAGKNPYDRTAKFMLDYMVRSRGVDPRRIQIVKGGNRARTTYELWIVPPGADLPVVQ